MKLALISLLLASHAWAASFEASAPKGWNSRPNEDGSLVLFGPVDANNVSAHITIRHYPPGHPDFATFDAFIARQNAAPVFKTTEPSEALPDVVVAGRKAKVFGRNASEFVPPRARNTKEVAMREELVAVPAAKGFYLLTYYAPRSLHKKHRRAFETVLKSFKPAL